MAIGSEGRTRPVRVKWKPHKKKARSSIQRVIDECERNGAFDSSDLALMMAKAASAQTWYPSIKHTSGSLPKRTRKPSKLATEDETVNVTEPDSPQETQPTEPMEPQPPTMGAQPTTMVPQPTTMGPQPPTMGPQPTQESSMSEPTLNMQLATDLAQIATMLQPRQGPEESDKQQQQPSKSDDAPTNMDNLPSTSSSPSTLPLYGPGNFIEDTDSVDSNSVSNQKNHRDTEKVRRRELAQCFRNLAMLLVPTDMLSRCSKIMVLRRVSIIHTILSNH
jgi:hypothetical protein